jgi:hypothetical protein
MIDYYLKATSEEALFAALEAAGITSDSVLNQGYALDVIGTIFTPTGKIIYGEDGDYPEMNPVSGYHANLRCAELSDEVLSALPIIEAPTSPSRVWF